MNLSGIPLLTIITFLPLVGIPILLLMKDTQQETMKRVALGISALTFVVSLALLLGFSLGTAEPQFVEKVVWVPQWDIHYFLAVDGISLWLVLLTTLLMPIAILSGWNAIHDRLREYLIFMLLLETGMLGVFVSLDLFLFYIFWEFTLDRKSVV